MAEDAYQTGLTDRSGDEARRQCLTIRGQELSGKVRVPLGGPAPQKGMELVNRTYPTGTKYSQHDATQDVQSKEIKAQYPGW